MKTSTVYHRNGKRSFFIDGRQVSQKKYDAVVKKRGRVGGRGVAMVNKAYSRPLRSRSQGCHPSQVAEFNAVLDARGEKSVRYAANGDLYFETRKARRNFAKLRGKHDTDGSYGDG